MNRSVVVLFVEGETEKEFYGALVQYYKHHSRRELSICKIFNVRSIGRFERKVASRLRFEIVPRYPNRSIKVICCYDSDVFELAQKPPVNWQLVRRSVNEMGIAYFEEIVAVRMIEDWFLKDLEGLCKFLKIVRPRSLSGKNGHEKMKHLFKMGKKPKIYQKGNNSHKFIPYLDFKKIRNTIKRELAPLEGALGVKLDHS